MSTRSVRLDDEAESALDAIISRTGLSISDAIKQGLIIYKEIALKTQMKKPADFFDHFDFGEDNSISINARDSKNLLKEKIRSKLKRDKK